MHIIYLAIGIVIAIFTGLIYFFHPFFIIVRKQINQNKALKYLKIRYYTPLFGIGFLLVSIFIFLFFLKSS